MADGHWWKYRLSSPMLAFGRLEGGWRSVSSLAGGVGGNVVGDGEGDNVASCCGYLVLGSRPGALTWKDRTAPCQLNSTFGMRGKQPLVPWHFVAQMLA